MSVLWLNQVFFFKENNVEAGAGLAMLINQQTNQNSIHSSSGALQTIFCVEKLVHRKNVMLNNAIGLLLYFWKITVNTGLFSFMCTFNYVTSVSLKKGWNLEIFTGVLGRLSLQTVPHTTAWSLYLNCNLLFPEKARCQSELKGYNVCRFWPINESFRLGSF